MRHFLQSMQGKVDASSEPGSKTGSETPAAEAKREEPRYWEDHWPKTGKKTDLFEVSIGSLDEPELTVTAQYRPPQLQIDKALSWQPHPNVRPHHDLQLEFSGGGGRSTTMELFFDAAEIPGGSVEESLEKITRLSTVRDPASDEWVMQRPHFCVLVFGHVYRSMFRCVIESLSTKITMFSSDGHPIRATVTVKLKETNHVDRGGPGTDRVDSAGRSPNSSGRRG